MKSRRQTSSSIDAVEVVAQDAAVLVVHPVAGLVDAVVLVHLGVRGAEGRDLDDLHAEAHVREMEAPADQAAVAEQPPHLLGVGVGRDVEVLRAQAEQQVAHGATDQEAPGNPPSCSR